MQITAPDNRLYVVVGVVQRENGELLMQQRPKGKDCEEQWEFPGGKLEANETPTQALSRELNEELGITITQCEALTQIAYDYPHANVWLDVFLVKSFSGSISGVEGQTVRWLSIDEIKQLDLLDAVYPILDVIAATANKSK